MDSRPLLEEQSQIQKLPQGQKLEYRYKASLLDKLFFGWIDPVLRYGSKHTITDNVLEDLSVQEQSQSIYYKWHDYWHQQKQNNQYNPLLQSIKDTFKRQYIVGTILFFLSYQFAIITPVFVYFAAEYLNQERTSGWSFFFLLILPLIRFGRSFFEAHSTFILNLVGTEISNSVSIGMVTKAMRYSSLCNKRYKNVQIQNLMHFDCFKLSLLPRCFNQIIFIVYCLLFSVVFMAVIVEYAFIAGFFVVLGISFVNAKISKRKKMLQDQLDKATSQRMKVTSEVFNNIKYVKMNAYEEYFHDKMMERRTQQVDMQRKLLYLQSLSTLLAWLASKWVIGATFGAYLLMEEQLTPSITFSMVYLFWYLENYLQALPHAVNETMQALESLKRIQKFLLSEQINVSCITYDRFDLPTKDYKSNAIEVVNGNFYWDKYDDVEAEFNQDGKMMGTRQPILNLTALNYSIKKGQFVCIIGNAGSGKSSLLYSLLGEMKFKQYSKKTKVTVNGTISFVPQKPWIVNETVRNNITFGQRFDQNKFKDVIKHSCLEKDLQILSHGDQTMIGEKGAALSDGQKARISFARSLYSNSDILLLDDLFSSMDVHVGKFMMKETLLNYSRTKTRVLITNSLSYLKYADKVIIMDEGKIIEQGSYEIVKNGSRFKELFGKMMKKQKVKGGENMNLLELDESQNMKMQEQQSESSLEKSMKEKIENQIIAEASMHSKKSKDFSAVDRRKLEELRKKVQRKAGSQKLPRVSELNQDIGVNKRRERQGSRRQSSSHESSIVEYKSNNTNEPIAPEEIKAESSLQLYLSYTKYNRGYTFMGVVIFFQLLWLLSNSLSNIWLAKLSEKSVGVLAKHTLAFLAVGYLILGVIFATFAFVRSILLAYSTPLMSTEIHESMVRNILFSSLHDFFDYVPLGRIFTRLSKDLNSIDFKLNKYWTNVLVFGFLLGSTVIVVVIIAPIYIFLPVVIIYFIACFFLRRKYSRPSKDLARIEKLTKSPIVTTFGEILEGTTTIRCNKKQDLLMQNSCFKIDQNKKPNLVKNAIQIWFTLRLTFCNLFVTFIALIYILFFTQSSYFAAADGALLLFMVLSYDEITFSLCKNLGNFESELSSIQHCEKFLEIDPEKGYIQYLKHRQELKIKSRERRMNRTDNWPDKGRIDFIDFSCRYRKNLDFALRGINISFTEGCKIGVVGRAGSGKTSILLSLLRVLQAQDGKVLIDGKDISYISLDDLRSRMTIILQQPSLFSGTLRQNIDPLGEYSDIQLNWSLQQTNLKELFDSRQGLLTQITEDGNNLTQLQKQLINISKAILKPTKVVLIDDATADLDLATQQMVNKTFDVVFKESTVITISNKVSNLINNDQIIVMQNGIVKQFDSPQQLLKNPNSYFTQLYSEYQRQSKK